MLACKIFCVAWRLDSHFDTPIHTQCKRLSDDLSLCRQLQKKRKFELAQAGGSRESTPVDSAPAEIVFVPMQREEVVRRLRLMNQPVTYFGESDEERQRRLHQIELIVSERQQGSSAGAQKNIFQLMNESVEAEIEAAMAAGDDADESNSDDEVHAQNGAKSQGPIGASGSAAGSF